MNEYSIKTEGRGDYLRWIAESAERAYEEATKAGHTVEKVCLVKTDVPPAAPGVVCLCYTDPKVCPAHGRRRY